MSAACIISHRDVTVSLEADSKEIEKTIRMIERNLKNMQPLLTAWSRVYRNAIRLRFEAQKGIKRWPALSMLSTVPLRIFDDITRMGTPPHFRDRVFGGKPLRILRSRKRGYFKSWVDRGDRYHVETQRPDGTSSGGASLIIKNLSRKTVHETGVKAVKGFKSFRGKKVPARPVAYIAPDEKLLGLLLFEFDKHIWKDANRSGGMIASIRKGLLQIG